MNVTENSVYELTRIDKTSEGIYRRENCTKKYQKTDHIQIHFVKISHITSIFLLSYSENFKKSVEEGQKIRFRKNYHH